ncbi:MAG TPA: 2-oxo acid dehydrogenase subunit E2 [Fermentimonas caenicola]|jgi:pyruvate dehydrogenase E2 component (dihydrolipoamide acetyltransferase)|uniref:dihydrolipoamide acetyltransferase family protein n=1 Tax=Lascolabacillus sp. TaxID=1924068 RepID=UPI0012278869|nr:dihydrolipoamide acetyltransferase family protein [Lascolabacillus sp.]MBP6176159.1 2-oxo acid dehydrogenase subunit E2 [Fermentimonas sp.]MDI9624841.1 dihydrolipoamide acetyltransferase family protein [Bacteroidota bacterium]TAH60504.1 MAG: 2-oxo acid dehydrogenase subunit E2 [Fermentimonas caenicola]MBP6197722.1 2-oxo acid dehydrogenase subunit E2 [Fermentimonas sp.]MBP7105237.1 2-oxo acid dehydrogenase subunit E2 [Fermentimonas sp.]
MKFTFNFPDLGEGLEEGTIMEWYVKPGQQVKMGDSIVQMETDKVVADIPSPKNGVITDLFGEVGDVIKVGSPLVIIQIEGEVSEQTTEDEKITTEAVSESDDDAGSVVGTIEVAGKNDIMAPSDEGEKDIEEKTSVSRKALATPVARAMAKQMGIDINQIPGSGPSGRVKKEDILNFKSTGLDIKPESDIIKKSFTPDESLKQTAGDVTYKPLTQIRKTIAKNMLQSKHNAAHMSVFEEVEISGLMEVRSRYKQRFADKGVKLTYLPFIVKAVAQALKHHPQLNSQIDTENNRMIYRNRYHIGIAVDAPDGLVVPVIRDADKLSIFQIAGQIGELANKARTRKLTLEDLKDGCFSITSFGSFGGIYATPVLNYPQAGILGIGRILKTPVVKDDEIVIGNIMPLSLTVDHRVVDGGETTRFIYKVMEYLTDPISFLMEE